MSFLNVYTFSGCLNVYHCLWKDILDSGSFHYIHLYMLLYRKLIMEALEPAEKMSDPSSPDILDPGLGENG
jgi:hypothetical protein